MVSGSRHALYLVALAAGFLMMVQGALAAETIRQGFAALSGTCASAALGVVIAKLVEGGE